MERPIQEDFTRNFGLLRIMIAVVMVLMLIAAIIAHDRELWLMTGIMLAGLPLYFRYIRGQSLKTMTARAKTWVQTDDGLRCTYGEPPETEIIRWDQIERMRWLRPAGLMFFWQKSSPQGPQFRDAFRESDLAGTYRGLIRVDVQEADEIAAAWQKHRGVRPAAANEPHPLHPHRPGVKKLNRQARNAVWLGSIMGGFFMAWAGWNILQELPSASWPSTQGKITSMFYGDIPWDGRHSKKGRVSMTYQYTVNGHDYTAIQYDPRNETYVDVRETASAFAAAHPRGSAVPVYYDPKQPDHAVLKAGVNWNDDSAFLILGLFFAGIAQFARFAMLAQAKPARRTQSNWLVKDYRTG